MDTLLYERLLGASFRYLSYRQRSERELMDYLMKKTVNVDDATEVIQAVVNRLRELQFIDDKKFAEWWISSRMGRKPKGAQLVVRELSQKGVDKEIVAAAMEGAGGQEGQIAAAKRALAPKLRIWASLPIMEQKRKLYEFLGRRGFSSQVISRAIDWATKKDYNS
jgi:regulatory protein